MIEEVMHEHRAREMDQAKTDMEFHEKLKALQQQKIQHLKTLQGLAEKHINEMGGRYSKDTNRYNPESCHNRAGILTRVLWKQCCH